MSELKGVVIGNLKEEISVRNIKVYEARYANEAYSAFYLGKRSDENHENSIPNIMRKCLVSTLTYFGYYLSGEDIFFIFEDYVCSLRNFPTKFPDVPLKTNGVVTSTSTSIIKSSLQSIQELREWNSKHMELGLDNVVIKRLANNGGVTVKLVIFQESDRITAATRNVEDFEFIGYVVEFVVSFGEDGTYSYPEAKDLLLRISERGTLFTAFCSNTEVITEHPMFWDSQRCLSYIYKIGEVMNNIGNSSRDNHLRFKAEMARIVIGNWHYLVPTELKIYAKRLKPDDTGDFLRYLRNSSIHLIRNSDVIQTYYAPHPDNYYRKFRDHNIAFLIQSYVVVENHQSELHDVLHHTWFDEFLIKAV